MTTLAPPTFTRDPHTDNGHGFCTCCGVPLYACGHHTTEEN
jgi:hypothetical protein